MKNNFLIKNKSYVILYILTIVITEVLVSLSILSMNYIIDNISQKKTENVWIWLIVFSLSWVFIINFMGFERLVLEKFTKKVSKLRREEITNKITKLSYEKYNNKSYGEYLSWYTNDAGMITNNKERSFLFILSSATKVFFLILTIIIINYIMLFIILGFIILSYIVPFFFKKIVNRTNYAISMNNEENSSKLLNVLNGLDTLFLLGNILSFTKISNKISTSFSKNKVKNDVTLEKVKFFNEFFNYVLFYSVFILSGFLVYQNLVGIGVLFIIRTYTLDLMNSLNSISSHLTEIKSSKTILEKLNNHLSEKNDENHANKKIDYLSSIEFKKFNYFIEEKPILENFSFKIEKNKKYLIIGPSGSGKSTIAKLMTNLYKSDDGIFINQKESINMFDLIEHFSFVENINSIFEDTMKNNITLWDEKIDHKKYEISKKLSLINFLEDEEVLKNTTISSGQKQRIAIARAFYADKKFLIFDEAMSNIDKKTSTEIEKNILQREDITFINISHNLNEKNLDKYDFVLNLSKI